MDGGRQCRDVEMHRRRAAALRFEPAGKLAGSRLVREVGRRSRVPSDRGQVGVHRDQVLGDLALAVGGRHVQRRQAVGPSCPDHLGVGLHERSEAGEVARGGRHEHVLAAFGHGARRRSLHDCQVRIRAIRPGTGPQGDPSALRLPQVVHDQARCRGAVDVHVHLRVRKDDARVEPGIRIGGRNNGLLEQTRVLSPQLLPTVVRSRDVLHRLTALLFACGLKVERPEVDGVVGRPIHEVERDADEARLSFVLSAQVQIDGALAEHHAIDEDAAVAGPRIEVDHGAVSFFLHRDAPVERLSRLTVRESGEVGLDRFAHLCEGGRRHLDQQQGRRKRRGKNSPTHQGFLQLLTTPVHQCLVPHPARSLRDSPSRQLVCRRTAKGINSER